MPRLLPLVVIALLAAACTSPNTETAVEPLVTSVPTEAPATAEGTPEPAPTPTPTPSPAPTPTPAPTATATLEPSLAQPLAPPTATPATTQAETAIPPGLQEAVVTWIIDGDTIDVEVVTDGDVPSGDQRIRLLEIDTPERDDDCYETATDVLADYIPVGSTVFLERDTENTDPNGRYLRYIWSETEGLVNVDMVAEGMAEAFIFPLNRLHEGEILAAEDEAQELGLGIWGPYCDGRP